MSVLVLTMHSSVTNVLFVSRENACRGLLAEACLRQLGNGKFRVFSCGAPSEVADQPKGWTLLALQAAGIPATGLHCKSWTEFTRNGAVKMDFVIKLDAETAINHPAWVGQPVTALWEYPPIIERKKNQTDLGLDTMQTLLSLRRRIELLVSLRARSRNRTDLQHDLRDLNHV